MKPLILVLLSIILLLIPVSSVFSQTVTADFRPLTINNPSPGYIFLAPYSDKRLAVLDNSGTAVLFTDYPYKYRINDFKFRFNKLWYAGGNTSFNIYSMDQNMNLLDSFTVNPPLNIDFHDFQPLANGHFLILAQETRTVDMSKIVTGGKTSAKVIGSVILELDSGKNIVFQWNALDHFLINDASESVNLTASTIEPFHCNSLEPDSDGNILLSSRTLDEVTKINRSNGEIIWRLGGKKCKNNQFTFTNDTVNAFWGFSHQHDVRRLPNGHLSMFDNGNSKPSAYSRAVEYSIDEINKTITKVWDYRHSPDIFNSSMGSVQRLPNGNTFIGWGASGNGGAIITEVTPGGGLAFEAASDNISFYRALRFVFKMNAVTRNVNSANDYSFNEPGNQTAVSINANTVTNIGSITVEKHRYQAHEPAFPPESKPIVIYNYRWMITGSGSPELAGVLRFNMASLPEIPDPSRVIVYYRNYEGSGQFTLLATNYNNSSQEISAPYAGTGEYILASNFAKAPVLVSPETNTLVRTDSVALDWNICFGAHSYRLQVSDDPGFNNLLVNDSSIVNHTYMFKDKSNSPRIYWRVSAGYFNGRSPWSTAWSFDTRLIAPALLLPSDKSAGQPESGSLTWQKSIGAGFYSVQLDTVNTFINPIIELNGLTDMNYDYKNLENNKRYFWRAGATIKDETTAWSEVRSFTVIIAPPKPLMPPPGIESQPVNGLLAWEPSLGAIFCKVQLARDSIFTKLLLSQDSLVNPSIPYNGLQYNIRYYWRVNASDTAGASRWSSVMSFRTRTNPAFAIPLLTRPANNAEPVLLSDSLVWLTVPQAGKYRIQIDTDPLFNSHLKEIETKDTVLMLAGLLSNFSEYYWRVKAIFQGGEGVWSEIRRLRTIIGRTRLLTPADGSVDVTEDKFIWAPVSGALGYGMQISLDTGFSVSGIHWQNENINDTITQTGKLDSLTRYYWRVRAVRNDEKGDWSQVYNFITGGWTSAEIFDNKDDNLILSFYTGLSTDMTVIQINVKKATFVTMKIYSILGSEAGIPVSGWLDAGMYRFNWDWSMYPSGSYLYSLTGGRTTLRGLITNVK